MQLVPAGLVATVLGLLLAPYYTFPQLAGWTVALVFVLLAFALRRKTLLFSVLLILSMFLAGNLRYALYFPSHPILKLAADEGKKQTIIAEVKNCWQRSEGRWGLDLRVEALPEVTADSFRPFGLRLFLDSGSVDLLPGDRVRFRAKLREPRLFGTPGEFHWPRYLAALGIEATSWLKSADQLTLLSVGHRGGRRFISAWRYHAARFIALHLGEQQAPLVRALLLGEARALPEKTREILAEAGVSHLFAISGLHLGLLGLLAYRLLCWLYSRSERLLLWQPPQKILPLVVLPLLLFYLLLTGDAVSTRRAFSLAAVGSVLLFWRRRVHPLRLLSSLALIFLLINPLLLWQASWQLSFAGVAGILLWQPGWQNWAESLPSRLRSPVRMGMVTLAATLATLPLVLESFHLVAPAGLLANLLCIPLVAMLALPAGLIGLAMLPLVPWLAETLFSASGALLDLTVKLAGWLVTCPGLAAQYQFLSPGEEVAIVLLVLPLLLVWQVRGWKAWFGLLGVCAAFGFACWSLPARDADLTLTMFSVGQGESMLLQTPEGQAILIDGGGLYSDHFDVGERLLAPALGQLGVSELDAILLTHNHPDHRKGLLFLLRHFKVGEFWAAKDMEDLPAEFQRLIKGKKIHFRRFSSGWENMSVWNHGKMMMFYAGERFSDENDRSLVLYLQQENDGLLLTGDLESKGVSALLTAEIPGPVSLLKVPHHGSRYSAVERLLGGLEPQLGLVSVGYRNHYHLPANSVVEQFQQTGTALYRTDLQGTVRASSNGSGWQVRCWSHGLFR